MKTERNQPTLSYVTLRAFALVAALGLLLAANTAQAGLLVLGVDSAASSFSAQLNFSAAVPLLPPISLNSPSLGATLSGVAPPTNIIPATTGFLGTVATTGPIPGVPGLLHSDGGGFNFTDINTTLNGPNIPFVGGGSVTLGLKAPHVDLESAVNFLPTAAVNGSANYDFAGLDLTLTGALFQYSSSGYLSFIGSGSTAILPAFTKVTLPPNSIGTLTLAAGPPAAIPATLTIPLSMTIPLWSVGDTFLGATVNGIFNGTLVLTGIAVVPEPGSIALLGIGVAVVLPVAVRKLRRR